MSEDDRNANALSHSALTTATFAIGNALNNEPIKVLGCVMTCLLIVAWATVFSVMIRAVVKKDILWPQKQEDREEGGWRAHPHEKQACDTRSCDPLSQTPTTTSRRRMIDPEDTDAETEQTPGDGPVEPREVEDTDLKESENTNLPVIAENLIDQSVRGRGPKRSDDIV